MLKKMCFLTALIFPRVIIRREMFLPLRGWMISGRAIPMRRNNMLNLPIDRIGFRLRRY